MSFKIDERLLKPQLHERVLLALVMRFFQTLSRRQREMKIARVATLELATRQVKKSQEKSHQSWNFRDKIAEIVARVVTLQLFARACDATKDYLANEIKVGMSVYSAQACWSMRFARPSICRQNLSQV